eukprot:s6008_g1.t1
MHGTKVRLLCQLLQALQNSETCDARGSKVKSFYATFFDPFFPFCFSMSKNIAVRDELLRRIADTHEIRRRIIGFLPGCFALALEFCPKRDTAGFQRILVVGLRNFHRPHLKYITKTTRSIEKVSDCAQPRRLFVCGRCDYCVLQDWRLPVGYPYDLTRELQLGPSQLRDCDVSVAHCPDIDRRKICIRLIP